MPYRYYAKALLNVILLSLLAFFSYLLLKITLQYVPIDYDVAFLRIKQEYIEIVHWRTAFFIHVFTSLAVLVAVFTQFSTYLLQKKPEIHRFIGYVYIIDIVFVTGPAAFVMSLYANGGYTSRIAFTVLSVLWWTTTALAWWRVMQKRFAEHRNFMVRSYALTLSAVTLRLWKYGIVWAWHLSPMDVYRMVAWLGFVPNLIIAELLIQYYWKKK